MSCRHPQASTQSNTVTEVLFANNRKRLPSPLHRNVRHLRRAKALEKRTRLLQVEAWIGRLDAQKEPVARGQRESRHVEHRMKRHREAIQREHPEHGGKSR